jgi:hypothetical protein
MLALAVFFCARAAQAREVPLDELRRFDTPQYTIVAASESEALQVATYAAEIEQALCEKLERAPRASKVPATLLLLTGKQVDRYLADVGVNKRRTSSATPSNYLLLPSGASASRLRRAVYHQVAHVFLQAQFEEPFPYWYEEGFASLSETLRIDGQRAEIGRQRFTFQDRNTAEPQEGNRVMDKEGPVQTVPSWISLARVFSCDDTCSEFSNAELRYRMRREQWAVVHRALIGDVAFGGQVSSYLQLWRQRMPIEQAVQQSFGSSVDVLDGNMRTYASRENFSVARMQLGKHTVSLRESQSLRPGEVAGMLASLGSMHAPVP